MLGILDKRSATGANKEKGKGKSSAKDLQRLNRYDLLELLVGQMREGDELRLTIANGETRIAELNSLVDRLKDKLDLKDEQIEHRKDKLNMKDVQIEGLKGKLDQKDEQIEHLKKRLDDKDAFISRLKKRLDDKDALIARLSSGEIIDPEVLKVLDARERAAELEEAAAAQTEAVASEPVEPKAGSEDDVCEPETQAETEL